MRTSSVRRLPSRLTRLLAVVAIAATLAGCADGLATDAQRGKKEDQSRDSVVTDLQATQTWNIIHGSPEATPGPGE